MVNHTTNYQGSGSDIKTVLIVFLTAYVWLHTGASDINWASLLMDALLAIVAAIIIKDYTRL